MIKKITIGATRQAFVRRQRRKRKRLLAVCTEGRFRLSVFRSHRQIYAHIIDDRLHKTLVAASSLEKELTKTSAKEQAQQKNFEGNFEGNKASHEKRKGKEGAERKEQSKCIIAHKVGELLAERALQHKVERVAFDCGGYQYHGRVQALAEGARKKGLLF